MKVEIDLTDGELKALNIAANEWYHHTKALAKDEIYGALILSQSVLDARSLWLKIEEITKIKDEW